MILLNYSFSVKHSLKFICYVFQQFNDLDVKLLAGLTDDTVERKRYHLLDQNLPRLLRQKDHMTIQKCYRVPIVAEFSAPHTH